MRELIDSLRTGLLVTENRLSLLDTHAKFHGTEDQLPDRDMSWHDFGEQYSDDTGDTEHIKGWGHRAEIHDLHPNIAGHLPGATHATVLYDPKHYVLHRGDHSTHVKGDEPDFHHLEHTVQHSVYRLVQDQNRFTPQHLHTDTLHTQQFNRHPLESAQQFSNRVNNSIDDLDINIKNDRDLGDEKGSSIPHFSMDPLEYWKGDVREKNIPILIGYTGSMSHHVGEDSNWRHNQITQDVTHVIKVK